MCAALKKTVVFQKKIKQNFNFFFHPENMKYYPQKLLIFVPHFFYVLAWLPKQPRNRNSVPPKAPQCNWVFRLGTRQRTMMMLWWCVAMIINAFERQQEIKELYQDDAYTILHIIHEKTFAVGYKKGPAQLLVWGLWFAKTILKTPKTLKDGVDFWDQVEKLSAEIWNMTICQFWADLVSRQPCEASFHN